MKTKIQISAEERRDHLMSMISNKLPVAVDRFILDECYKSPNYIFYDKAKDYAFCTHCNKQLDGRFLTHVTVKHKTDIKCPECGFESSCRCIGRYKKSRMALDLVQYTILQKTAEGIVMRRFEIERECTQQKGWVPNSGQVQIKFGYRELQRVFNDGLSIKNYVTAFVWTGSHSNYGYVETWKLSKKRTFNVSQNMGYYTETPTFNFTKNISSVIRGTPFRYAKTGKEPEYYAFWIKPMELFEKVEMEGMVSTLNSGCRRGINVNATDLYSAMGIQRQYRDIVCTKNFNIYDLYIFKKMIRAGCKNITKKDLDCMRCALNYYSEKSWIESGFNIKELLEAIRYSNDFTMYYDYIKFCRDLGYDITDPYIRFPKNLQAAHDREMKRIKAVKNQILEAKVADRYQTDYKSFFYTNGLMFIRPPQNIKELTDEGSALHHCVGTYANQVAEKVTTILFIRLSKYPDTPFYTLEWRGSVEQCRGKKNEGMTKEVSEFIDAWQKHMKFIGKKRSKKNEPEMELAVAI